MSDWTGESIVDGFPRVGTTYWIQFITEPEIITKDGQYGGTYKQALIRLQFFMPDEFGEYHYSGWGEKKVQPCVLEHLTEFGPDIMNRLIKVTGVEHKKHVDLDLIDSWDKISAKIEPLAPITNTTPPPPAAVAPDWSERDKTLENCAAAAGNMPQGGSAPPSGPCSHPDGSVSMHHPPDRTLGWVEPEAENGFYCVDCGDRVG